MKIIIVGCGRVGAELAYRLFQQGHNVTIIDQTAKAFTNLNPNFRGRSIEGEALNQDLLLRAGIDSADGLAAVTNSDTLNAAVAHIARTVYNLSNVVVRNYNPDFRAIHEAFGHQIVGSSSWGAQRIEELLSHREIRSVFSSGNGEIEIYEFSIPKQWHGYPLSDLIPQQGCRIVSLTRSGRAFLPESTISLEKGDILLISASDSGIHTLSEALNASREG